MRFAIVSHGLSIAWVVRLMAEGHEVRWFLAEGEKEVGDGIVDKAESIDALRRWANNDPKTVWIWETGGLPTLSDDLRKEGKLVIGGGRINQKMEDDRMYGLKLAKMLGLKIPRTLEVQTFKEAIELLKGRPKSERWYFKPSDKKAPSSASYGGKDIEDLVEMLLHFQEMFGDIKGILQEKVEGIVLDTAWWWNGSKILRPIKADLEFKHAWDEDSGPAVGCANNTIWAYENDEPLIAKRIKINDIEQLFQKLELVPGEYDLNTVISEKDKQAYVLEWGPRWGWDSAVTDLQGLTRPWGESLAALAAGVATEAPYKRGEYWGGVHVSVPPYPNEAVVEKAGAAGKPFTSYKILVRGMPDLVGERFAPYSILYNKERDKFYVADRYGSIGVALGKGREIKQVEKQIDEVLDGLKIPDLQFRTDFGEKEPEILRKLKGWGFDAR